LGFSVEKAAAMPVAGGILLHWNIESMAKPSATAGRPFGLFG
jgi:hypothetical protein